MVEVALDESPVRDDAVLLRRVIERVETDPETGKRRVVFGPSGIRPGDFRLMTGLRAARFDYLDPEPKPGDPPAWVEEFEGRPNLPFPTAVRLRWVRDGQTQFEMQVFPLRAQVQPEG